MSSWRSVVEEAALAPATEPQMAEASKVLSQSVGVGDQVGSAPTRISAHRTALRARPDLALASTGLVTAAAAREAHAATLAEFSKSNDDALALGSAKEAEGASSVASKAADAAIARAC